VLQPLQQPTGISSDAKENRGNVNPNASPLHSSVSAYEDMLSEDNRMIKQVLLADLAYVELCLENPLKAPRVVDTLKELPACSKLYVFLSHVYRVEALFQVKRLKDAAELLSIYLCDDNSVDLLYSDTAREKWSSDKSGDSEDLLSSTTAQNATAEPDIQFLKPEEARGVLYVALATMNAMKGDLKQAVSFVTKALLVIPNNPRALLAAVYLDILLGKTQDALAKLKQCSHVRFYHGTVTQQLTEGFCGADAWIIFSCHCLITIPSR
jgi:CCR4-NOT transcription complex subunit 10